MRTPGIEKADGSVFRRPVRHRRGLGRRSTATPRSSSARYYADSYIQGVPREDSADTEQLSARDGGGHGTHTASTAAGDKVHDVVTKRSQVRTVTGVAPAARLAVYKVCWEAANPTTADPTRDVVAAIDQRSSMVWTC